MSKVLKEVVKFAGNLIKKLINSSKKRRGDENHMSAVFWIVAVCVGLLFLLMSVTEVLVGPVATFTETISSFFKEKEYTQEEMEYILADAGRLAEFMEDNRDFQLTDENSFLLDRKTVIRILKAVDEYNEDITKEHEFTYEYLKEEGPLSEVDPITGETEVVTQVVRNEVVDTVTDTEVTRHSSTASPSDVSMVIALLERDGATGITVTAVSANVLKVSYTKTTVTERQVTRVEETTYQTVQTYHEQETYARRVDMDTDMRGVGEDVFYLRWQPIVAFCSLYIQDNYLNIGSYDEEDEDGKSYYLSNREIQKVIDVFKYEYSYYFDMCADGRDYYDYDFIFERPSGYRLFILPNGEGVNASRTIKRIPAIAPRKIENSYLTYEYNYEVLENGYRRLKERTYTLYPQGFIDACEQLAPSFDGDLFVLLLECLPLAEDLAEYYGEKILPMAEAGEIYTDTTDDILKCPSIGIIVSTGPTGGNGSGSNGGNGGLGDIDWDIGVMEWTGEYYEVPLYPIDGWGGRYIRPAEFTVEEGNSYGTYKVYEDAMKSLTVSDGFTLEEMEYLFMNGGFSSDCPLFANEQAIKDTAKCFYDYQQETGTSVCGLLGMMRQEGGFTSAIARNGWNFFNIKATDGQPVTSYTKSNGNVVVTEFRNYRAEYEYAGAGTYSTPAVNALDFQMGWVNRNYWQKGQNSFYLMIWNGYDVNNPAHAYETISHSYCPPWDDQAMPYSQDSYVIKDGETIRYWKNSSPDYEGWINKCAKYRFAYYTLVKGSS